MKVHRSLIQWNTEAVTNTAIITTFNPRLIKQWSQAELFFFLNRSKFWSKEISLSPFPEQMSSNIGEYFPSRFFYAPDISNLLSIVWLSFLLLSLHRKYVWPPVSVFPWQLPAGGNKLRYFSQSLPTDDLPLTLLASRNKMEQLLLRQLANRGNTYF